MSLPKVVRWKAVASKGIASILDIKRPRLEGHGIITLLRIRGNELYSFVLELNADVYSATELVINTATNAQLWHRRLGHLNKRTLKSMQRRDCNGIPFDGTASSCDVCAVGENRQLAHADIKVPFQLVHGNLVGPFTPAAHEIYKCVSKITDQFSRRTAIYLLCSKDRALALLQAYFTSTLTPLQ